MDNYCWENKQRKKSLYTRCLCLTQWHVVTLDVVLMVVTKAWLYRNIPCVCPDGSKNVVQQTQSSVIALGPREQSEQHVMFDVHTGWLYFSFSRLQFFDVSSAGWPALDAAAFIPAEIDEYKGLKDNERQREETRVDGAAIYVIMETRVVSSEKIRKEVLRVLLLGNKVNDLNPVLCFCSRTDAGQEDRVGFRTVFDYLYVIASHQDSHQK